MHIRLLTMYESHLDKNNKLLSYSMNIKINIIEKKIALEKSKFLFYNMSRTVKIQKPYTTVFCSTTTTRHKITIWLCRVPPTVLKDLHTG